MERAMGVTKRRRELQIAFNKEHGITPRTIQKALQKELVEGDAKARGSGVMSIAEGMSKRELSDMVIDLEAEMHLAAKNLEFERAAELRDRLKELRESYTL
jgi:excinuclease ABC subunit B